MEAAHILITGAAGQLGYVMAFRIANGDLLGDRKVVLHLLEIPSAMKRLHGITIELHDCSSPFLEGVIATDDPKIAFKDIDYAFLIASVGIKAGQVRRDLLAANATIFKMQGEMLSQYAKPTVKVLVVGNPANTNCLIAMHYAKNLKPSNFSCLCRLDHDRCIYQLSKHLHVPVENIHKIIVWGNHAETQVPDAHYGEYEIIEKSERKNDKKEDEKICKDKKVVKKIVDSLSQDYLENEFVRKISQRAWEVFEARGNTSAGSAVNASLNQMRDWIYGTKENDFVSMGIPVPSNEPYGIHEGIVFSFPCTVDKNGNVKVVENLPICEWTAKKIKTTEEDLKDEKETAFKILEYSQ